MPREGQVCVSNLSHGYYYFHYYELPEKLRNKLSHIDNLMINRFETDKSKDRRYHHRKAGKANYIYLRYELMIAILRSEGEEMDEKRLEQRFQDIRKEPLEVRINGGEIVLKLHKTANKGMTVHFTPQTCPSRGNARAAPGKITLPLSCSEYVQRTVTGN